jgi:hypothetical protein
VIVLLDKEKDIIRTADEESGGGFFGVLPVVVTCEFFYQPYGFHSVGRAELTADKNVAVADHVSDEIIDLQVEGAPGVGGGYHIGRIKSFISKFLNSGVASERKYFTITLFPWRL